MKNTKIIKNIKLLRLISKSFGLRFKYIILFTFNTLLGWLNSFFFFLDRLFFPSLKKKALDRPIFLVGHLRSGTTFLHRFLSNNCHEIASFYLWEMLFPALSLKKILRPFVPLISKISLDKVYDPNIHKTGLNKEETDDIALYFRFLDGMLSWIYFHAWQKFESNAKLVESLMSVCNQPKFVSYFKRVYQIISYQTSKRVLSKSFSALLYIDEMVKENPDAKFIILIRNPKEAIPSLMSLEESVQKKMHGQRNFEKYSDQYFRNLYQLSVHYYATLEKVYDKYKDHKNFLFVSYNEVLNNFKPTIYKITEHCELILTNEMEIAISHQVDKQDNFQSSHSYSLNRFGLDETTIKNDTPFYNRFVDEQSATKGNLAY